MARRTIDDRLRRSDKIVQSRPAQRVEGGHTPRLKDAATEEVRRVFAEQIRDLQQRIEDLERTKQSVVTADGGFVPKGYINGLTLDWTNNETVKVFAGEATDSEGEVVLTLHEDQDHGWEALDTGSEANSTHYYVYLVGPAAGGASRVVWSATYYKPEQGQYGPTRNAGERFRYIGSFYNDSSGGILEFIQTGKGHVRTYQYDSVPTDVGTSSGYATRSTTSLPSVPDHCQRAHLRVWLDPNSAGNTCALYTPSAAAPHCTVETRDTGGSWRGVFECYPKDGQIDIDCTHASDRVQIRIAGWIDYV